MLGATRRTGLEERRAGSGTGGQHQPYGQRDCPGAMRLVQKAQHISLFTLLQFQGTHDASEDCAAIAAWRGEVKSSSVDEVLTSRLRFDKTYIRPVTDSVISMDVVPLMDRIYLKHTLNSAPLYRPKNLPVCSHIPDSSGGYVLLQCDMPFLPGAVDIPDIEGRHFQTRRCHSGACRSRTRCSERSCNRSCQIRLTKQRDSDSWVVPS